MKENIIKTKSYAFAVRIVKACQYLSKQQGEFVLSKQLLRSGTAIGALVAESENAQSKADFINKLNIALKEANETQYWLSLLKDTNFLEENVFVSMNSDCNELVALLVSIIKTTKLRIEK